MISTTKNILLVIGVIFILTGIIGGLYLFINIDFSNYKIKAAVYKDLRYNEFARIEYEQARNAIAFPVALSVAMAFSGITTGIFFISLCCIIDLLSGIKSELRTKY